MQGSVSFACLLSRSSVPHLRVSFQGSDAARSLNRFPPQFTKGYYRLRQGHLSQKPTTRPCGIPQNGD
jgi:hypothetical protein